MLLSLLAEIHAVQTPGQQLALDAPRPPARRADQAVKAVHDGNGSIGVEGYSAAARGQLPADRELPSVYIDKRPTSI